MKIHGYLKLDSNVDKEALRRFEEIGCDKIYEGKTQSSEIDLELMRVYDSLMSGDILVINQLQDLTTSFKELVNTVDKLLSRNITIKILDGSVTEINPNDKLDASEFFSMMSELEKELLKQRTNIGLTAARERGKLGGRPKGLGKEAKRKAKMAQKLYEERIISVNELSEKLNISKSTLYSYLRHRNVKIGGK